MNDYKELVAKCEEWIAKADNIGADDLANHISRCADAIEQLIKDCDAAVADLEKCLNYAEPKNNNVCNFCKKDMSEYPDKCDGWSDFCKCEPEWRGAINRRVTDET